MNRLLCVTLAPLLAYPALALARDKIRMVGSPLPLTFAEPVAQRFSVHQRTGHQPGGLPGGERRRGLCPLERHGPKPGTGHGPEPYAPGPGSAV